MPIIKQKLSKYAMNDVWNADEFGFFYKMAPTRSIDLSSVRERSYNRNFPFLIIGK